MTLFISGACGDLLIFLCSLQELHDHLAKCVNATAVFAMQILRALSFATAKDLNHV
jgi:hypothetical protein